MFRENVNIDTAKNAKKHPKDLLSLRSIIFMSSQKHLSRVEVMPGNILTVLSLLQALFFLGRMEDD